MKFSEVVVQTLAWLQREGRVSYRALKREFALDDEFLEDLKAEIIEAKRLAMDENGKVLVWAGKSSEQEAGSAERTQTEASAPSGALRFTASAPRAEAERRQLTVMFCDLVGSTQLSERLDPEDLRQVVQGYQETCAAVIHQYEGHVAQYLGDGLLVYFGYPVAHEDDPQRAVRAGLGIVEALPRLNAQLQHAIVPLHAWPLQVRLGIHTGLVVIGELGKGERRELMALGETPNLAARLQGIAEPNTLVISATTARLVHGLFTFQALGPQPLKGVSVPMEAYRVLAEGEAQSRFEVAVRTGLTPLVGREQELGLLSERWGRAKEGAGQVVLLTGEAGIGKSRLAQVLKERAGHEGATRLECRCSPYYRNSAFYLVIDLLQRAFQFQRDDTPKDKLRKLEEALQRYNFDLQETVPLLAALLSLRTASYPLPILTPQKQKEKTQQALIAWFLAEAERHTVLSVWEDLHWADPSSLELLGLLIDQAATVRLGVVLTARPEFRLPWALRAHVTLLTLNHLPRAQAEEMVTHVTGSRTLPAAVVQQIVSKTDGVPLFVEELTKMVLESGLFTEARPVSPLPSLAIPTTLQDALMARLDRLATGKEVAQLGATLGREFSYELLQAVAPVGELTLQQALAKLVEAEVLYQRGLPPQARYLFKHALLQDAAYQSLLKSTRQQYHHHIAQVLEERFPETKESEPELLAHHCTEAGLTPQAVRYWRKAGQRAVEHSAHAEAIAQLTRGIVLLQSLPDTPERAHHELRLQIALSTPLIATKGYIAPEVEHLCRRAQELCQQLGETPQLFPVLGMLHSLYFNRGELQRARDLAVRLLRLAQHARDPRLLLWAHYALGFTAAEQGEFVAARAHLEQSLALYDPQQHRLADFVQDPRVTGLAQLAHVLLSLGYPDRALQRSEEALTFARTLAHPFSLAWVLESVAGMHRRRAEPQAAQALAEELIALASEQGFGLLLAQEVFRRGWDMVVQGQEEEGITQMHQGLTALQITGTESGGFVNLALLANAYGKVGQPEAGLPVLAEALARMNKTEAFAYAAELYRLKGELLLQQSTGQAPQSHDEEAEGYFRQAIESARQQSAKSLELRAAMSLSRLWQQQGKKEEARKLLAEIYTWFTEGFDTKDLQEAKALLEELA